jgi:hypothetical protein
MSDPPGAWRAADIDRKSRQGGTGSCVEFRPARAVSGLRANDHAGLRARKRSYPRVQPEAISTDWQHGLLEFPTTARILQSFNRFKTCTTFPKSCRILQVNAFLTEQGLHVHIRRSWSHDIDVCGAVLS